MYRLVEVFVYFISALELLMITQFWLRASVHAVLFLKFYRIKSCKVPISWLYVGTFYIKKQMQGNEIRQRRRRLLLCKLCRRIIIVVKNVPWHIMWSLRQDLVCISTSFCGYLERVQIWILLGWSFEFWRCLLGY